MSDDPKEDPDLYIDDDISPAMRAEAAARGSSANNWMLAALITTNGGGILTLLNQPTRGWAVAVALVMYLFGVTMALVAGRQAAMLSHETESLLISSMAETRAVRMLGRAVRTKDKTQWEQISRHVDERAESAAQARADFEKIPAPDMALGIGVICFFLGSIFAGVGLF
jgi:hypothetical protein